MKKPLFIILALLCLALTVAAKERTIVVNGNGSVRVEPDSANVQLGVEYTGKTAQSAQSENAKIMKLVMEAVEKAGIKKNKIMTSNFNIWPEQKYEQNQPPKTIGYRCSNQVNISIEELALISKVIDAGIAAGANNVAGLQFARKEDQEFKKLALSKAVQDAASKAQAIATASSLKIKGIETIVESGSVVTQPFGNQMKTMAALNDGGSETPVSPGLIDIRGSVSITYLVE
ncbi:MAG: SIMPL domain-containing protein [Candidatus Margulisiibacteriota bacterium]|jgi:hypothetical protein